MNSHNTATPAIVGALAIATIVGAAGYVLSQSNTSRTTAQTPTKTSVTTTTPKVVKKDTTSQPTDTATATNTTTPTTNTTPTTPTEPTPTPVKNTSGYVDGTYSATTRYQIPHGMSNDITVTVTLKDGIISDVGTNHSYVDHESASYTDSFDSHLSSLVVGKSITAAPQSRVGGASLTTLGFNDAIAAIASQAKG